MSEEMIEIAFAVKAYLAEHTGFISEYDGDYIVAAYYGGHWVTLDCVKIAEAALSAYNPNERLRDASPNGDAGDAIDYALGHVAGNGLRVEFLEDWRSDQLERWHGYHRWLKAQRDGAARSALSPLPQGEDT